MASASSPKDKTQATTKRICIGVGGGSFESVNFVSSLPSMEIDVEEGCDKHPPMASGC